MELKLKRPLFVTLLAVVVFSLSAANFASLVVGLARWQVLDDLGLSLPLWLIMVSGGIWGLVWLVMAWGLWKLRPWARWATIVCLIVYQVTVIGQQGLFAQGDYERSRLPFAMGISILSTTLVIIGLTRPGVRQAFEEGHKNDEF